LNGFKAKIDDVTEIGFAKTLHVSDKVDVDVNLPYAQVYFDFEAEARSWGIKYIVANIKKVESMLSWKVSTDELSEQDEKILKDAGGVKYRDEISGEAELNLNDWEIVNEAEFGNDGRFFFISCEFDFTNKKITLS